MVKKKKTFPRKSLPLNISSFHRVSVDTCGRQACIVQILQGKSQKIYTCPGCYRPIPMGLAHIVAWPDDGSQGVEARRHWHSGCWHKCGSVLI